MSVRDVDLEVVTSLYQASPSVEGKGQQHTYQTFNPKYRSESLGEGTAVVEAEKVVLPLCGLSLLKGERESHRKEALPL